MDYDSGRFVHDYDISVVIYDFKFHATEHKDTTIPGRKATKE